MELGGGISWFGTLKVWLETIRKGICGDTNPKSIPHEDEMEVEAGFPRLTLKPTRCLRILTLARLLRTTIAEITALPRRITLITILL